MAQTAWWILTFGTKPIRFYSLLEVELKSFRLNRRTFVAAAAAALAAAGPGHSWAALGLLQERRYEYCAFIKFIQDLSYNQLAQTLNGLGFDGAEVTVRKGGYIAPQAAADELPRLAEVFAEYGLKINILTTDIVGVDSPNAHAILKTAGELGIPNYRMGYCRYDMSAPIRPQLKSLEPKFKELAALNRESRVAAFYHNHSGAKYMGATFWDLRQLLQDISPKEIGCVFDVRHAVAEGGSAWPVFYDIIKPHITALSVKDFHWVLKKDSDKRLSAEHCPLGAGQVDYEKFLRQFKSDFERLLVTLHVEYLPKAGLEANIAAIKRDFGVLRKAMGEKG